MATIPELRPPDVEVIQVFTASTPSKIRPALMACIVGPCKQFLQPTTSAGAINSDAVLTLPAFAISSNTSFTGLGGMRIKVQYKTYTEEELTFDATPANPTAAQVVEQINLAELTGLSAQLVPDGSNYRVMIYTTAAGDLEEFKFVDPAADDGSAILGVTKYESYFGMGTYNQCDIRIPDILFPDPSGNLDQLIVDRTSTRVYINTSGTRTTEAKDDESILAPYNTAEIIGTVAINGLSYPDDLIDKILEFTLSTESEKSVTFFATLRAKLIAGYNEAAAKYTLHIAKGAPTHAAADAVNTLTTASLAATASLTQICAAWTDFLAKYDAHDADAIPTWHGAVGPKFPIGVAAPATWANCITFYNAVVAQMNQHLEEVGGGYHGAADPDDGLLLPVIWLYNEFAGDYANHLANSAAGLYDLDFHESADATNTLTASSLAVTATFTDTCNAWDDVKAKFNAHDATAGVVHKLGAGANAVAEAAATTLATLYDLASSGVTSCRTQYETHRASGTEHYIRDSLNTVTLTHQVANVDENTVVAEVNATWANVTASLDTNRLKLVSTLGGITLGDGTANTVIGFTDSDYEFVVEAVDDGDADTQTPYIRVQNADFTAAAGSGTVTGTLDLSADFPASLTGLTFIVGEDGKHMQTIEFSAAAVDIATVITEINDVMGAGFASNAANHLKLTSAISGYESKIRLGAGTAHRDLGFVVDTSYYGVAFVPLPGDELWQNGSLLAEITQVAPGGTVDKLKLSSEVATSYARAHCYIIAKDVSGASRPTADLLSDGYYFDVKHDIVRDYNGQPSSSGGRMLVSYEALRKDVTPEADDPSLLIFNTTSEVESTIPPMDDTNPLALGAYYALLNAPATQVAAIGVPEVSSDYPDGTLEGYASCFEFLEAYDVYSLVPLTQEKDVHSALLTHALAMSTPEQKMERIGIVNPALPTRELDSVVASGNEGESTAVLNQFETAIPDLVTLLVNEGLTPAALSYSDGVYLDIERDALRYNLSSVVGTIATVRVTFGSGENTDNYFTTTNLPTDLLAESFSVKVRGAEISTKAEQVEAYYYLGKSYASRRLINVVPDRAVAAVGGVDKNLPAYYFGAAVAGQIGQQNPSQPLTKLPISGFRGMQHSFPYFNQTQLNQIAAGGNYIFVQDTSGGPIYCRHQLSTDTTSIKTREVSITKAVDYAAKYYRLAVKGFCGPYNITPETYDALAMAMQSATENLIEDRVIYGANVGAPTQSTSQEDKTEIQVDLTVFTPNNTITITLVV